MFCLFGVSSNHKEELKVLMQDITLVFSFNALLTMYLSIYVLKASRLTST
jgi:hypothetical protein